jgi:hypothetical protein
MRTLIVTVLVVVACAMVVHVPRASAAEYSNASVAGSWMCSATGYVVVKNAKGATSWVPSNGVFLATFDGSGKYSGKTTGNTAGLTCSYTLADGSYSVHPDGTSTYAVTEKADSSNPRACPPGGTLHSSGVGNNSTFFGILTDSGATFSFYCIKQSGQ